MKEGTHIVSFGTREAHDTRLASRTRWTWRTGSTRLSLASLIRKNYINRNFKKSDRICNVHPKAIQYTWRLVQIVHLTILWTCKMRCWKCTYRRPWFPITAWSSGATRNTLNWRIQSVSWFNNDNLKKTTKKSIYKILRFPLTYVASWRRQWHPTPVLLPGKSHGRRSLVGCIPWGR